MFIQTVLGKVAKDDLGIISPHEHIFIDLSGFFEKRRLNYCNHPETAKVTMDKLGILSRDPYAILDNLMMLDKTVQTEELQYFKRAGGKTIVDATTAGIHRDPLALKEISEETGLHIIAGAGYYVSATHPEHLKTMSVEDIAEKLLHELNEGLDGTDIKAGVIGEIGISEVFDDTERKVLKAAALAQIKSGVGILVHINPWTTNGIEATKILLDMGVKPNRICICHIDVEARMEYINELLSMGVFIEFDNFGKEYYVDKEARRAGYGLFINDTQRVLCVKKLIEQGYLKQLLVSCDVCLKTTLHQYGGWGYDHVLVNIIPMMQEVGITKKEIDIMLQENPANFLIGGE